jgi:DNA-binding transcriptional MerR regulator
MSTSVKSPARRNRAASDTNSPEKVYSISNLSKEFGITTRAIRFYESRGLLTPARTGTTRRYSRRDRARLILILRGRNLGFSVEDVAEFLALYDADPGHILQANHLLEKVNSAIAGLERKHEDLDRALSELKEVRARCTEHIRRGL